MSTEDRSLRIQRKESYIYTGKIDRKILSAALLLILIGLVGMYDPSDEWNMYHFPRQCAYVVMGIPVFYIISRINYRYMKILGEYGLAEVFLILCVNYMFFDSNLIQWGWFKIGNVTLPMHYIILVFGCLVLADVADYRRVSDIDIGFYLSLAAAVAGFILCESWKYLLVFYLVAAGIFFLKFPRSIILFIAVGIVAAAALIIVAQNNTILLERLMAWIDPFESSDNSFALTANSLYMISSGGIFGQGIGGDTGLIEIDSGGIFLVAKIIKDMGWMGALFLIIIFAFFFWEGVGIIMKAPDKKAFYLGASVLLVFMFMFMINFTVNLNLLPYIGLPMPFVGGESNILLFDYILLGVLLNISRFKIERAGN